MVLPLQGTSILGGDNATVGFDVMLRFHPIVLILSALLAIGALVVSFLSSAQMKTIGMALGGAALVTTIIFVLYLERGFNVLHIGWALSAILLTVANLLAERD